MELETFASQLLNTPTAEGRLVILQAWHRTFIPETAMGGLSPRVYWERLKSLGLVEDLMKWSCVPSGETPRNDDLRSATQTAFKVQAASIIALSRFTDLPGIFRLLVEDRDAGNILRQMGHKSYSASFEKSANNALMDTGYLSYHRIASVTFLESIFTWAKFVREDALIKAVDRDYAMRLVYYVFFDPTAYQSDDPLDNLKPEKLATMVRCGGILRGLHKLYNGSRLRTEAAEEFIKGNEVSQIIERSRVLFVDTFYTVPGVVDASAQVLSSLLEADPRLQIAYMNSDISIHMLSAFWVCVQAEDRLPRLFPTVMLHRFAQCHKFLVNMKPPFFYRPNVTPNHARDLILLLGRAIATGDPKGDQSHGSFGDSVDVIRQYVSKRLIDNASEHRVKSTIISCMNMVLCSLHEMVNSWVLPPERGTWAISTWKEFMSKTANIQMEGYSPWKTLINPLTKRPYDMCSWYRCPMYRMESKNSLRQPLVCSACRMASYCSTSCQKSDWKEGQHRKTCKRPPPGP